jgi:hypothetical protein
MRESAYHIELLREDRSYIRFAGQPKAKLEVLGRVSEEGSSKTLTPSCDRAPMGAAIARLAARSSVRR